MSAFLPINPAAGQMQKRMLLERLMQQHMRNAQRYAGQAGDGTASPVAASGSTPFRSSHPFGGRGLVVQAPHPYTADFAAHGGPGEMARSGYAPAGSLNSYTNPSGLGRSAPLAAPGAGSVMPTPTGGGPVPAGGPSSALTAAIAALPSGPAASNPIPINTLMPTTQGVMVDPGGGAARANFFAPLGVFRPVQGVLA